MTTISLKIPDNLARRLDDEASMRGTSKSALVRDCIENALSDRKSKGNPTCADLAADLIGSQPGAIDSSTNPAYLKDLGRERKRSR